MATRKLTEQNKVTILTDWFQSATNRADILYFSQAEVNGNNLQKEAFGKGLLVSFTPVDSNIGQITFVAVLT